MKKQKKTVKRPKYKHLKKRMKFNFKKIRKAVKKGRVLDTELVDTFCADARLMTTFTGKGDKFYPAFLKQIERFALVLESGDDSKIEVCVTAIRRLEKECHKRYK